jgi:hypothetical protein
LHSSATPATTFFAALRELGRLERTLFTLDWLGDAELRRQTSRELNKGETRNGLARAVFIHRLGEIRDRTYENQQHRASGLNQLCVFGDGQAGSSSIVACARRREGPRVCRLAAGAGSLERTRSGADFPVNRENTGKLVRFEPGTAI